MAKRHYAVAFYEIDRAYGGSEEGGWWFNTGKLIRVHDVVKDQDEAYRIARRCNELLALVQRDLRDVDSVIYDGGRIAAEVYDVTELPPYYPTNRPHYE